MRVLTSARAVYRMVAPALLLLLSFVPVSIVFAVPLPTVGLNVPPNTMLGENFTFTVTFDNTGADTGYAPFLDVVLPASGADGNDGITFVQAEVLGQLINGSVLVFPAGGCMGHPFVVDTTNTPVQVCGTPGHQLVVLPLPFGSFTPNQPPVEVEITALMSSDADANAMLGIFARGGFRYGADALHNPCCDPPVLSHPTPSSSLWPGAPVTPVVMRSFKSYLGPSDEADPAFLVPPEPDETVTGPNAVAYPVRYVIAGDVAAGQTITSIQVSDFLPPNLAASRVVPGAGSTTPGFVVAGNFDVPGATLVISWPAPFVGNGQPCDVDNLATCDVIVTLEVYFPALDASNQPVLDPAAGVVFQYAQNTSTLSGSWAPTDPRDAASAVNTGGNSAPLLVAQALALQKSARALGSGILPGQGMEYTLDFQASDFYAYDEVRINDTLFDGQTFDAGFTPQLTLVRTLAGVPTILLNAVPMANFTASPGANGSTDLVFDISGEIIARGVDAQGRLIGGCVNPATLLSDPACAANTGLISGFVTFRTTINNDFTTIHAQPGNSGDASVDQGDILRNEAVLRGRLLDNGLLPPSGIVITDNSLRTLEIERGDPAKTIYAVNGVVCAPQPCANVQGETGAQITYRIRYDAPTSDFEDLALTDFLPLPVFSVNDPDGDGVSGPAWTFDPTPNAAPPPSGTARLGPADTFGGLFGIVPGFAADPLNNTLTFTYGDHDDPLNRASVIDILFTVTLNGSPFADGLALANHVRAAEGSTNAGAAQNDAIAAVQTFQPFLVIRKGIIGTSNPDAVFTQPSPGPVTFTPPGTPGTRWAGVISSNALDVADINSDASGFDPGDLVSFGIVIENLGTNPRGAFDIRIRDILPAGYRIPASGLNLTVTTGDGTAVGFVNIGGGLFDPGGGIELVDPSGLQGACQAFHPTSGANIILITYDLQIEDATAVPTALQNIASLTQFANAEGLGVIFNFVDVRDTGAYADRAGAVVGFLGSANLTFNLGVTELPSTGQSSWSKWRSPLFATFMIWLAGIVIEVIQQAAASAHKVLQFRTFRRACTASTRLIVVLWRAGIKR